MRRGGRAPGTAAQDPGVEHVHAINVNPSDGAIVFATVFATHTKVFRAPPPGGPPQRSADRYQDTMGLTVIGPLRFRGSGHPDAREELPPHLGLIESRDAGLPWRPISLLAQADFHALRVAGGRIYGFDVRRSRLMRTVNGGQTWVARDPTEPLLDFVVDLNDPRHLIAEDQGRRAEEACEHHHHRAATGDT